MAGYKSTSNYFLLRLQQLLYRLSLLATLIKAIQGNKCVHQMKENSYKHLSNNLQFFQISLSTWLSVEIRSWKSFFFVPSPSVVLIHCVTLWCSWSNTFNQKSVLCRAKRNAKFWEYFTKILLKNLMAVLIIRHRVVLKLGTSIAYPAIAFLLQHLLQIWNIKKAELRWFLITVNIFTIQLGAI